MICVCIGCGSSIKSTDFNTLSPYYTIGTNNIIKDYPGLKCGVFLDRAYYNNNIDTVKAFKGELWAHRRAVPEHYRPDNLRVIETAFNKVNTTDDHSWTIGMLSGLAALNIALLKGYREIYLMGYDMCGSNYHDTQDVSFANNEKLIHKFDLFKGMADIYNCNPDSMITAFPYRHLSIQDIT